MAIKMRPQSTKEKCGVWLTQSGGYSQNRRECCREMVLRKRANGNIGGEYLQGIRKCLLRLQQNRSEECTCAIYIFYLHIMPESVRGGYAMQCKNCAVCKLSMCRCLHDYGWEDAIHTLYERAIVVILLFASRTINIGSCKNQHRSM